MPRYEEWVYYANCSGTDEPDVFFPTTEAEAQYAISTYCVRCPVKIACDEYAERSGETDGVWGGISIWTRKRRRKARKLSRMKTPEPPSQGNGHVAAIVEDTHVHVIWEYNEAINP